VVKTNAPSEFQIASLTIKTNALPDPFDEMDLIYRPKLQPLPHTVDKRAGVPVLDQTGQSCTGHAVAGLIDTVLSEALPDKPKHGAPRKPVTKVSPYMLYALARRYDEFPGEADVGSSLRGAFKGWYHHGVCSERTWPAGVEDRDLNDPTFATECLKTPLGAYYRVNARRIDDMQSAITELNAIAASAAVHEGWRAPRERPHGPRGPISVIETSTQVLGGHAFLIAGYNDVGFLVQNSWGTDWGDGGYATLPYEDWMDNGYDAWVGRPGVPQVGVRQGRRVVVAGGRSLVAASGPNLARLKKYVIDVTASGRLSTQGKVTSSPSQLGDIAQAMAAQHDLWVTQTGKPDRRLVIYAHGGLVGEDAGISIADRMIDFWRANHVYPVHIVWESDPITTIFSTLDHVKELLPFGGLLDGFWEALDTRLEGIGRNIRPLWAEMKANARAASGPLMNVPPSEQPGVTLFIELLKTYQKSHPELEIHLVGHSAGAVVLAAVAERLIAEGIPVESLQLMGAAIRVDEFVQRVVPALATAPGGTGMVRRFTAYDLADKTELDDVCPGPPAPAVYHKSLLAFVARSLEQLPGNFEVPMVGLEKSVRLSYKMPDGVMHPLIEVIGGPGSLVVAPNNVPDADSRSKAKGHGEFDDDPDTMTSVVLRIKGSKDLGSVKPYPRGGMPTSKS
jgi:hypothetical protein